MAHKLVSWLFSRICCSHSVKFCTLFYACETNNIWLLVRLCEACSPTIPNCRYCSPTDGCFEQQCETGYGINMLASDLFCHSMSSLMSHCFYYYGISVTIVERAHVLPFICLLLSLWHFSTPSHDASTGHHNIISKVSRTIMNVEQYDLLSLYGRLADVFLSTVSL